MLPMLTSRRVRTARVSSLLGALCSRFSVTRAAAAPAEPASASARLEVQALPDCTTREEVAARVAARSRRIHFDDEQATGPTAPGGDRARAPRRRGELVIVQPDGTHLVASPVGRVVRRSDRRHRAHHRAHARPPVGGGIRRSHRVVPNRTAATPGRTAREPRPPARPRAAPTPPRADADANAAQPVRAIRRPPAQRRRHRLRTRARPQRERRPPRLAAGDRPSVSLSAAPPAVATRVASAAVPPGRRSSAWRPERSLGSAST